MKKCFFIYCFLFVVLVAFSQEGYEVGYIITNKGDTIKGKIKDRKYTAGAANSDKISFIDVTGKESNKTPDEIKQYCKRGTRFFRSLPIGLEGKLKFAEILEYGDVILFGYISNSFVSTTSEVLSKSTDKNKDGVPDGPKNLEYFFQKRKDPNSLMKVKPKKFEETATFFFQSDSELVKKIEDKILGYDNIRLVVKTHNELVEKK
ncbi:MAG TPA: hypothetical protein VK835_09605 [Bacteroidia bacterium]|jgi:hypothetical protein|nr:hypothetical protein [Bacteroidia bacterium]